MSFSWCDCLPECLDIVKQDYPVSFFYIDAEMGSKKYHGYQHKKGSALTRVSTVGNGDDCKKYNLNRDTSSVVWWL
jgi:hypothetical protein